LASERCFFFLLLTISDYGIVMINVFIPKMSSLMIYRMVINHDYVHCYVYELGLRSWWLGPKCRRKGIRKGKDKSHRMWDSPLKRCTCHGNDESCYLELYI